MRQKTYCLVILLFIKISFGIPTLKSLTIQNLLINRDKFSSDTLKLHELIKGDRIDSKDICIQNKVFKNKNFSNLCFKEMQFINCRFINFNFSYCDFSSTRFENCLFNRVNFQGCNFTTTDFKESFLKKVNLKGTQLCDDFSFANNFLYIFSSSHSALVKNYSHLMNQGNVQAAQGLNKILPYLHLNLCRENLQELNLEGICLENAQLKNVDLQGANLKNASLKNSDLTHAKLQNANLTGACLEHTHLEGAHLQETWLSEALRIPNYERPSELFTFWRNASAVNKPIYQKLLNAHFNMFDGLSNTVLRAIDWRGLNLTNANFIDALLDRIDFTDANFEYADFQGARLKKANLTNVLLANAKLTGSDLRGVILSENVTLPEYNHPNQLFYLWVHASKEEKPFYQKITNAGFNIFRGLTNKKLKKRKWINLDLKNANLEDAQLEGIDFTGTNFEGASLKGANIIKTNFSRANLKSVSLSGAKLFYDFTLPFYRTDKKLIQIYKKYKNKNNKAFFNSFKSSNRDNEAIDLCKQILVAKDIFFTVSNL